VLATFVHGITRGDEDVEGIVVNHEKVTQQLLAHALGDADALAVAVHLHQQLRGRVGDLGVEV